MKYTDFSRHVAEIEKKIGYVFSDKNLLAQAFTRTSFCNENKSKSAEYQSNEVLEFLGDSILSASVTTMLINDNSRRYEYGIRTDFAEGDFSNIKSKLSDKTNLSESIKKLGLQNFLLMGEGDVKLSIQNEPSVMEDLFESILGAVYIDSGEKLEVARGVIANILDVSVYLKGGESCTSRSYKNLLQELCASKEHRLPPPVYHVTAEGPEHERRYTAVCYVDGIKVSVGVGKNKKSAEADAARLALDALGSLQDKERKYDTTAQEAARRYARENRIPLPEYCDTKETEASTKTRAEFETKCTFSGISKTGIGPSKKEAREAAVSQILEELGIGK